MRDNVRGGALTEVTFLVLLSLSTKKHGYSIMQDIEALTDGRVVLGAGTLYGALDNLYKKGWIQKIETDDRKKDYILTDEGRFAINAEIKRLEELLVISKRILGEVNTK